MRKYYHLLFASQATMVLLVELIAGIGLSMLSLVLFAKLAQEVLSQELIILDTVVSQWVYSFRTPFLTTTMFTLTNLGSGGFLFLASVTIIAFIWRKHKHEAVLFSVTVIMGMIFNVLLKNAFHVPRPTISPLFTEQLSSFPSGHAMNSFIFYMMVAYFMYHFTKNRLVSLVTGVVAILLIVAIGMSRIYLGVHYPSDILAGYIAGFWWFITVLVVDKTLWYLRTSGWGKQGR